MKAEHREAELRIEMERRLDYQKSMESARQIESLERKYVLEKERRETEKRMIAARQSEFSENLNDSPGFKKRRGSAQGGAPHFDSDSPGPRRRGSLTSLKSGSLPSYSSQLSQASLKSSSSRESKNAKAKVKRMLPKGSSHRSADDGSDL